jgi:hypothetical protein
LRNSAGLGRLIGMEKTARPTNLGLHPVFDESHQLPRCMPVCMAKISDPKTRLCAPPQLLRRKRIQFAYRNPSAGATEANHFVQNRFGILPRAEQGAFEHDVEATIPKWHRNGIGLYPSESNCGASAGNFEHRPIVTEVSVYILAPHSDAVTDGHDLM